MIDTKPFMTSQNMAILLVQISKNIAEQAQVPASSNERLEKLVNELKSCADFVLELSKKEKGETPTEETVSTVDPCLDKASVTQEQVATFYYLVNDMYKEGKIDIDDLERHFDRLVEFARHANERFHQAPSSKELGLEESGLVKTF